MECIMEKYGTYEVYKNKKTGEIIRIPYEGVLIKKAGLCLEDWEKLDSDPEIKNVNI